MARNRRKKATGKVQGGAPAKNARPKRGPSHALKERVASIKVGATYRVQVTSVAEYGVSVHLGSRLLGFISKDELHWHRVGLPGPKFVAGEMIEAMVTSVNRGTGAVELSRRRMLPDPAVELARHYREVQWVLALVHSRDNSRIFVHLPTGELETVQTKGLSGPALSAITPRSQLWLHVDGVDRSRRRLRLSIKPPPDMSDKTLPPGHEVLSIAALRSWAKSGADASRASQWTRAGWDLRRARPWLEAGIHDPRAASAWRDDGIGPSQAGPWRNHDPQAALPWMAHGVSPQNAAAASSIGLTPDTAAPFLKARFSVEEAQRLIRSGTSLESAIARRTERQSTSGNEPGPAPGWWHGGE